MYFIFSKPDDCSPLGYGPGLVLNHIHNLSLTVILFFIASTVLLLAFFWMPRREPQPKSPKAHSTHLYMFFSPGGANSSHCIVNNSIENYSMTPFFLQHTTVCFYSLTKGNDSQAVLRQGCTPCLTGFYYIFIKKKMAEILRVTSQ